MFHLQSYADPSPEEGIGGLKKAATRRGVVDSVAAAKMWMAAMESVDFMAAGDLDSLLTKAGIAPERIYSEPGWLEGYVKALDRWTTRLDGEKSKGVYTSPRERRWETAFFVYNLTCDPVHVRALGAEKGVVYPPTGLPATVRKDCEELPDHRGFFRVRYGKVIGLPDPRPFVLLIVNRDVWEADDRPDLITPREDTFSGGWCVGFLTHYKFKDCISLD